MKASFIRKTLTVALAALLFALSLASCKATLKPGENGLYDKQSKVTYSHASTVYEATKLVKEYGKLALTKDVAAKLNAATDTGFSDVDASYAWASGAIACGCQDSR